MKFLPPSSDADRARYIGQRAVNGCVVCHFEANHLRYINARLDLANHSPTGFDWGYAGSGPSQLALALIADATGDDELALATYREFKVEIIATLPREGWELDVATVAEFARHLKRPEVTR